MELQRLLGRWEMTLSNAAFLPEPGQTVTGTVEISDDGGVVAMRQFAGDGPPAATWVIGSDDSRDGYVALYADARGVHRIYEVRVDETTWKIWRDDPEFSQRFEATIGADGHMRGAWEKRVAGGSWEHDFDVEYSRLRD